MVESVCCKSLTHKLVETMRALNFFFFFTKDINLLNIHLIQNRMCKTSVYFESGSFSTQGDSWWLAVHDMLALKNRPPKQKKI